MKNSIRIYFDGSFTDHAHAGAIIYFPSNKKIELSECVVSNLPQSNNVAEHFAVTIALNYLLKNSYKDSLIEFYGDSRMTVMQLNKRWKLKNGAYVPFAVQNLELLKNFTSTSFHWIPRLENYKADSLSKCNLDKVL